MLHHVVHATQLRVVLDLILEDSHCCLVGKGARHFEEPRAPLCREAGEGKLGQEAKALTIRPLRLHIPAGS